MPIIPADLAFVFTPKMNHEDMLKEMHSKVHTCTLSSKLTMQAIICVTMTYEAICSTARAAAAAAHLQYVPHTMLEYLALIDRPAHALRNWLILYKPTKPVQIYVSIGLMPLHLVLMVSNTFWLSSIKARSMSLLLIPRRVPTLSIC